MNKYTIKEISAPETFAVRHPVLREGKAPESCLFDRDELASTHHYGIFEEALAGVVSVFQQGNALFPESRQLQLRGMAVLARHRGKGYGVALLRHVENGNPGTLLWFNAREVAVGFYSQLGYTIAGEPFEIGDIGTHFIMYKRL